MYYINPQFVTDNSGKKISVILPIKEFQLILDELEELEDIRLYDSVKKRKLKFIDANEAFDKVEAKRKKNARDKSI